MPTGENKSLQLAYKAEWYGRELIKIDRWFPSSKRCSSCGHIVEKRCDPGEVSSPREARTPVLGSRLRGGSSQETHTKRNAVECQGMGLPTMQHPPRP